MAVVHALKALHPYLFDQPFELHTDNASLQWLQQQRHVSHHQARWLNLLAEFQFHIVHIQGRTNQAYFLTRKRFPDGSGPALQTGYNEQDSALELFTAAAAIPTAAVAHACTKPDAPSGFLHADFAAAVRAALPTDSSWAPSWQLAGAPSDRHEPVLCVVALVPTFLDRGTILWALPSESVTTPGHVPILK